MHKGPPLLPSGHVAFTAPTEFDLATAPDVMSELDSLIDLHPWIVVDLSTVGFVDSSGLSALVWARKKAVARGGGVALVGASTRTRRLLELTQLDRVFSVHDDLAGVPPVSPVGPSALEAVGEAE